MKVVSWEEDSVLGYAASFQQKLSWFMMLYHIPEEFFLGYALLSQQNSVLRYDAVSYRGEFCPG